MDKIIIRLLINTAAVIAGAYILKGIKVDSPLTAAMVAIVIALLNTFLKPILVFLTLPFRYLTFGLFIFILNGALIMLAAQIVPGFRVTNFIWAFIFGFALSVLNMILNILLKEKK